MINPIRSSDGSLNDAKLLINVQEVATILGVSTRSVWRLLSSGKIPQPLRLGGVVRWKYQQIQDWIDKDCPSQSYK